jgi:hypothetical protein
MNKVFTSVFIDRNNIFSLQLLVVYRPPLKARIESLISFNEKNIGDLPR